MQWSSGAGSALGLLIHSLDPLTFCSPCSQLMQHTNTKHFLRTLVEPQQINDCIPSRLFPGAFHHHRSIDLGFSPSLVHLSLSSIVVFAHMGVGKLVKGKPDK